LHGPNHKNSDNIAYYSTGALAAWIVVYSSMRKCIAL